MDTCRHPHITVYAEEDGPLRMWACSDCNIRFYPACEICISVGHRNEEHIDPPEVISANSIIAHNEEVMAELKRLHGLVREMIHHECWDGDNFIDRPFLNIWKGSEWEQEDLSILIGAMFK